MESASLADGRGASARTGLEEMLEFEGRGDVLAFRFSREGLLYWPFVRWGLFLSVVRRLLRCEEGREGRHLGWALNEKVRYAWQSYRGRPTRLGRTFDVLIFGSTAGVSLLKDGKWFGRINDYFAGLAEDQTLVLDHSQGRKFKTPRFVRHVALHDWIKIRAALAGRLFGNIPEIDEDGILRFIKFLKEKFPFPLDPSVLNSSAFTLRVLAARLPFLHRAYAGLLESLAPKVVFLEDGSYGRESYIFAWCRERGIVTGEIQHGLIVPTHHAYNYGGVLRGDSEYSRYMPEYLLTYGRFWSENVRSASRTEVIGNPHLEAMSEALKPRPRPTRLGRRVLVVSQTDASTLTVELVRSLARCLPAGDRILFRPHPLENSYELQGLLRGLPNVEIREGGNIYDLFLEADAVIGTSSTALFEAAAFNRPVFVYDSPTADFYIPRRFGVWFKDAEDFLSQWARIAEEPMEGDPCMEKGWQNNYRRFLKRAAGVRA